MKQLFYLVLSRLREFRREPSAFLFVLLIPVLWLAILGFLFDQTQNQPPLKMGVSSVDKASVMELGESFTPMVSLEYFTEDDQAQRAFLKREIDGWAKLGDTKKLGIIHADPDSSRSQSLVWILNKQKTKPTPVATISTTQISRPKSNYIDYLVPGLIAMTVLTTSLFGIGMTLVANRREGLLTKYRSTPVKPLWFFSSYYIGRLFIFALELATILFAAFMLFNYASNGFFWKYFLVGSLGCICFSSISIFLAARTSNVGAYSGKANLVMLVFLLVGNVFYQVPSLPWGLGQATSHLPLNTLTQWLRHLSRPELYSAPHISQVAVFILITVVFFSLSMWVFRWDSNNT